MQPPSRDRERSGANEMSVYHPGEVAVQTRAGVRQQAERGGHSIRRTIPLVGATFLRDRDLAFVATTDLRGQPWASLITGDPGFLDPIDERTLRICATPAAGDPLVENLVTGRPTGLLAIDFERRRRMRVNGRLDVGLDGSIHVRTDQVYSNCPKYIQARMAAPRTPGPVGPALAVRCALSDEHRTWIHGADTFFIATSADSGVDISHRGGRPGFVRVEGHRLVWGDYRGNSMFNTLGNLAVEPRAGLLFVDFERGRTLHLAGRARVDWSDECAARIPGAERVVEFDVDEVVEGENMLPQRLRLIQYSPFNPDPA